MCPKPQPDPSDFRCLRTQQGMGLPAAIFIILILALLAVAISELEQSGSQAVSYEILSTRAFLAAESGAQIASHRVIPPDNSAGTCTTLNPGFAGTVGLEGCSATVTCRAVTLATDTYYTLESTGRCGSGNDQTTRRIEVRITSVVPP